MLARWKGNVIEPMRLRRCKTLWLEPREVAGFELERLLAGGTGVHVRMQWFARAPHLEDAVPLDEDEVLLLGRVAGDAWQEAGPLAEAHGGARISRLLEAGLLVGDAPDTTPDGAKEARYRAMHWNGLAATWHAASRWHGVDAAASVREAGVDTSAGLRQRRRRRAAMARMRASRCPAPAATRSTRCSTRAPPAATSTRRARCASRTWRRCWSAASACAGACRRPTTSKC